MRPLWKAAADARLCVRVNALPRVCERARARACVVCVNAMVARQVRASPLFAAASTFAAEVGPASPAGRKRMCCARVECCAALKRAAQAPRYLSWRGVTKGQILMLEVSGRKRL